MEAGVVVALAVDADLDVLVSYADGSVSEEIFDHIDVHAVLVEMGRAGVTEAVRGEASPDRFIALGDSEFVGVLFDHSRDRAFAALAAGEYGWMFVTSAASVEQLAAHGVVLPPATRLAAVGPATARAARQAGYEVAFVPDGHSSASALALQWCAAHAPGEAGRSIVVRSDLATATVSDELQLRGFAVDVCIAYRTVGVDLDPAIAAALRAADPDVDAPAAVDVVLLTSLSVARELRRQVGALPRRVRVASIGPGTTRDAERLGFSVTHTARTQSIDALVAELDSPDAGTASGLDAPHDVPPTRPDHDREDTP